MEVKDLEDSSNTRVISKASGTRTTANIIQLWRKMLHLIISILHFIS
jgi:hypothetical protein